jgi:HEAT repeat protein
MGTSRVHLGVLILIIGCQLCVGAENPAPSLPAGETAPEAKPDEQLVIIKNALLQGPSEEIRIKAATVMLTSEDPLARESLLYALKQTENSAARMAVCEALIQVRPSKESVKDKDDFIGPLLGIFDSEIVAEAQLAAKASLIFEYEQIGESLEKIVKDAAKPVKTRVNAIYALKLRLDMMATIRLIELVDDPEKQIAAEAEKALNSLGIQVGSDPETRQQNIEDIKRQGQEAFLRTRLIRQDTEKSRMEAELRSWLKRYLTALGELYNTFVDDTARGKFLATYLNDPEAEVRSWALEKVRQGRLASGTSKLPPELKPVLVDLISDQDKGVRLKTAELLAFMPELDSASRLLAQLESEQDNQVKAALFVALGGACSYALRPQSPASISAEMTEVRKQTLVWAAKFLSEEDAERARNGAEVIRKLLERDGLKPEEVDRYLGLLAKRHDLQKSKPDGALRGELLSAMAGLCAQDSTCRDKAAKLFQPLFEQALRDETDFVRETAVDGLVYINKTSALEILRKGFVNDPSEKLREKLIELADEVGGKEDLDWLAEKIGFNSESEPAWQAMLKIYRGSDAGVLNEGVDKLTSPSSKAKLSREQKVDFLKIAEAKVEGENKLKVHRRLADFYHEMGQFGRAADYLGKLHEAAKTPEEKEAILPDLLDAYLRGSKLEPAAELVKTCLSEGDMDPNNAVVRSIDSYLSKPPPEADPNAVIKALSGIEPPEGRPKWHQWLESWAARLSEDKVAKKPEETVQPKEE